MSAGRTPRRPAVRLRPMTRRGLDEVLAIEQACFPTPWTRDMFEDDLGRGGRAYYLVARSGGSGRTGILGYGGFIILDDAAHVTNLAVLPDCRREGVATRLLLALLDEAARRGIVHATLEVRESNEAARMLYERFGFQNSGRRRRYYADTGEDALILWSDDLTGPAVRRRRAELVRSLAVDGLLGSLILGIETSCDETAAAVIGGGEMVLSSVIASQSEFHRAYGGVVPELASRKHLESINAVVDEALAAAGPALEDMDAIAVTTGPGLAGALLVGVATAKAYSAAIGRPLIGVNHIEGHIVANYLADPELEPPFVCLVVSGGHTSLIHVAGYGSYEMMGETMDDAAGEAFDKVAGYLGLGYPGGPVINRLAKEGDREAIKLPRAVIGSNDFDFSLSGLKTAVLYHVERERAAGRDVDLADLAASFEAAVVDVQVHKSLKAAEAKGVQTIALAGGVAANTYLRGRLASAAEDRGLRLSYPGLDLCTDNAAMIAAAAWRLWRDGETIGLDAGVDPNQRIA